MRSMPRLIVARPGTTNSSPACQQPRAHHRRQGQRHDAEVTTAIVKVSANSRNMRPTSPDMNSSGMNTAINDTVSEIR
jgi:hypothetical protein